MGKRANLIEIMEMDEVFNEYVNNAEYLEMGKMGDNMLLGLKNRILEQKVEKLEEKIEELLEKIDRLEAKV